MANYAFANSGKATFSPCPVSALGRTKSFKKTKKKKDTYLKLLSLGNYISKRGLSLPVNFGEALISYRTDVDQQM